MSWTYGRGRYGRGRYGMGRYGRGRYGRGRLVGKREKKSVSFTLEMSCADGGVGWCDGV
jgi:hypothetical protein